LGSTPLLIKDAVHAVGINDVPPGAAAVVWKNNMPFQVTYSWAGQLRAILKAGAKVYYVWYDLTLPNNTFGNPFQPTFINVGSVASAHVEF
jgi:hypothetical protein